MASLTSAENSPTNENLNIEILINSNFYWKFFNGNAINVNESPVIMDTFLGGGRAATDYANNSAVKNAFKIATAQIDTTPDSIKRNDKILH